MTRTKFVSMGTRRLLISLIEYNEIKTGDSIPYIKRPLKRKSSPVKISTSLVKVEGDGLRGFITFRQKNMTTIALETILDFHAESSCLLRRNNYNVNFLLFEVSYLAILNLVGMTLLEGETLDRNLEIMTALSVLLVIHNRFFNIVKPIENAVFR